MVVLQAHPPLGPVDVGARCWSWMARGALPRGWPERRTRHAESCKPPQAAVVLPVLEVPVGVPRTGPRRNSGGAGAGDSLPPEAEGEARARNTWEPKRWRGRSELPGVGLAPNYSNSQSVRFFSGPVVYSCMDDLIAANTSPHSSEQLQPFTLKI